MKKTTWEQELPRLGKDADNVIAKRLGVSRERVRQIRAKRGIKRPPKPPLARRERNGESEDNRHPLPRVPLSASDRQTLTDARVAKGLTQSELGERVGYSTVYIYQIESGIKRPSPDLLNRICATLGLKWNYELTITITPKRRGKK